MDERDRFPLDSTPRFCFLGRWEVRSRSGEVVVLRPKERAVLEALILSLLQANFIAKDAIHEQIWPGEPMRRQLDNQLHNLRTKLPEDIPTADDRSGICRLNVARDDVDVWKFFDLATQANKNSDESSWLKAFELWPQAGPSFLNPEHPATPMLHQMLIDALQACSDCMVSQGRSSEAIPLLSRLVSLSPDRIASWQMLIDQTRKDRGYAAAQLVLREAEAALASIGLAEESGLKVSANRHGKYELSNVTKHTKPEPGKTTVRAEMERAAELEQIRTRLAISNTAVLEGAPGNGKSWLANRVADESDLAVVRWTFRASDPDIPDDLIVMLARHFQAQGSNALSNLLAQEIDTVERFDNLWKVTLTIEAFVEVPTLMLLDDVHVLQPGGPTSNFLRSLLDRMDELSSPSRVLIVSRVAPTQITDESVPGTVYGLTKLESSAMLSALGVNLSRGQMATLYAWTSGNLKLLRMFAAWVNGESADGERIDRLLEKPSRWRDARRYLLKNFLAELSIDVHSFVNSLSLLRSPVGIGGLWEAARFSRLDAVEVIEDLTRRHIIEELPDGSGFYLHGVVRDFLRDALATTDTISHHRTAAIAQRSSGSRLEEIFHVAGAGDRDIAMEMLVEGSHVAITGGNASQMLDLMETLQVSLDNDRIDVALLFCELLRLVGRLNEAVDAFSAVSIRPDKKVAKIARFGRSASLRALGRWSDAIKDIDAVLAQLSSSGSDVVLRSIAEAARGSLAAQLGDFSSSRRSLKSGINLLRESPENIDAGSVAKIVRLLRPTVALSSMLCDLGWLELMAGELGTAEKTLREAGILQKEHDDKWGLAESLGWLGRCYWQAGRWEEAENAHEESLKLAREMGNVRQEALAFRHLGLLAWNRGNTTEAYDLNERALKFYRQIGDRYGEAACLENLAAVHFDAARFGQASELLSKAEEICNAIDARDFLAYAVLYKAKVLVRSEDVDGGIQLTRTAYSLLRERNYSAFYTGMALRTEAEGLILRGSTESARLILAQAIDEYTRMGSPYQRAKCQYWVARSYMADGEYEQAQDILFDVADVYEALDAKRDLVRVQGIMSEWWRY